VPAKKKAKRRGAAAVDPRRRIAELEQTVVLLQAQANSAHKERDDAQLEVERLRDRRDLEMEQLRVDLQNTKRSLLDATRPIARTPNRELLQELRDAIDQVLEEDDGG
jgi:hypothetical protein